MWDEAVSVVASVAACFGAEASDMEPVTCRSDVEDLTAVVGAAVGARDVLQLRLVAALARHQAHGRSLPLRTAVARVAARHLPLGNSHGYFS
ncbi:hypothetical protein SBRY_11221 [Actinacidiphila bryophytorum]|uniref:Uncharacterized protein n=1 Tax=Actinacidiphila bryophytorum TaxID=1436133 RepID=A0A9W4GXK8_9ACTN|nr:hypothetical protein SBRY_11221 [Actinacidiphila bryophytorum]